MMTNAIIFGGTGYVGTWTWKRLYDRFDRLILADVKPPTEPLPEKAVYVACDVRRPLAPQLTALGQPFGGSGDWIFHYSAVHREPGHHFDEYFDTNLPGAEHVTAFASQWDIHNIYFTSSISIYGPSRGPTSEDVPKYPNTGYGISKLISELIHERWAAAAPNRRLITCRPGVIYGPGDPGNILRLIKAVKHGFFFAPGDPKVLKSYAYIEGMMDSLEFTMDHPDKVIRYNYVEYPTDPLCELVDKIQAVTDRTPVTIRLPRSVMVLAAGAVQLLTGGRSSIHPERVRKAAMPTHIIPQWLIDEGFDFRYDFATSLADWQKKRPEDF